MGVSTCLVAAKISGFAPHLAGKMPNYAEDGHPGASYIPQFQNVERREKNFIRGDCDGDGAGAITDAVLLLNRLFLGGAAPGCADACDANDSGDLDLSDAVWTLSYLFLGGPAPLPPFPAAGPDPTPDPLGCQG